MSPSPRIEPFETADWLSPVILVASLCFAVLMSWRSRGSGHRQFMTLFLEGVTLAAASVLLISAFYKPWFDAVLDNRVFLIIVAFMTMTYGFRDIAASIRRSRSSRNEHQENI